MPCYVCDRENGVYSRWEYSDKKRITALEAALADKDARIEALEAAFDTVVVELSALLPEPSAPDWMPALGANNPADAESLQKALDVALKHCATDWDASRDKQPPRAT